MAQRFTPDQLDRLQAAVAEAETRTSAEIVPCVVKRSDRYPEALARGAVWGGVIALVARTLFDLLHTGMGWGWLHSEWGVCLVVTVGLIVGALLGGLVPSIRRALVGSARMDQMVHRRAMRAFVEEEVFNTKGRTGVLLLLSLDEHRVEVLADEGISSKVAPEAWGELTARIIDGIRDGDLPAALIDVFDRVGVLLGESGLPVGPDDVDELDNHLRIYAE
jgi:putative membrane protein